MNRLTDNKIVLVTRPTRLAELVIRFNTVSQARFYVEHQGADFSDYLREDETYHRALSEALAVLAGIGRVQVVDRGFLPNFVFAPDDTVVTLGQDGLVANTLKYLNGQPVVGVNPDPERWDGRLLPFRVADLSEVMPEVLLRKRRTRSVTMAKASLNNGQTLFAVNDLFIGPKTHCSARYVIRVGETSETQSSSGVIVSTGLRNLPADYHASNFYPQVDKVDRAEARYGSFLQLLAQRHVRGRVVAFTDSTQFSNFCLFDPGKSELFLGMTEWLNHRSTHDDPRGHPEWPEAVK